jgi:hypothetical protein
MSETAPQPEVTSPSDTTADPDNWHSTDEPTVVGTAESDDQTIIKPDNWHST